ncbi:MAG: cupredoxin domain-containing protein [Chloroflexota bacterium]
MRQYVLAAACIVLTLGFIACSSSDSDTASPTLRTVGATLAPASPATQPAPAQALNSVPIEPQDDTFELTAAGTKFEENFLKMSSGGSVTIRLTNNDTVPHSLRIAGLDGRFDTDDDAVTNPAQIDSGGSGELVFAPQADGAYTFRCDFHPTTMGGQIIVGSATPGSASTVTETPAGSFPPSSDDASESPTTSP